MSIIQSKIVDFYQKWLIYIKNHRFISKMTTYIDNYNHNQQIFDMNGIKNRYLNPNLNRYRRDYRSDT